MKKNKEYAVVLDRDLPGKHRGTDILMMFVRKRLEGEKTAYSKEVAPGWIVDFDAEGKMIAIELLCPRKHFPKEILDLLPSEFVTDDEFVADDGISDLVKT